jgi:hypothetical protein
MDNDYNCMICHESIDYYGITNCNCKIYVHKVCIDNWLKLYNKCIICKNKLNLNNKQNKIKMFYLNREFENCIFIKYLSLIFDELEKWCLKIKNIYLKIFFFNIIFGFLFFIIFVPLMLLLFIKSQIKYSRDFYYNVISIRESIYYYNIEKN